MEITPPDLAGNYNLVLYLMCDSYLGCDQEYEFSINVIASEEEDDDG
jgi:pre-mRNA-splicing helicase BRR2